MQLPQGMSLSPLEMNSDERGSLRIDWPCRYLGQRDRNAGSLAAFEARLRALDPDLG
jgi:hypothetical protein